VALGVAKPVVPRPVADEVASSWRVTVALSTVLSLLAAACLIAALAVVRPYGDRETSSLNALRAMHAAMLDQETGLRGWLLTGKQLFLQPYTQGVLTEATARAQLSRTADARSLAAPAEEAADDWSRSWADKALLAAGPEPAATDVGFLAQGRAAFDDYRTAEAFAEVQLDHRVSQARDRLELLLATAPGLMVLLTFVTVVSARRARRRMRLAVVDPLMALDDAVRSGRSVDVALPAEAVAEVTNLAGALLEASLTRDAARAAERAAAEARTATLQAGGDRLREIVRLQEELLAALTVERVSFVIAEGARRLVGGDGALMELVQADSLHIVAATGSAGHLSGMTVPMRDSLAGVCVRTRQPIRSDDVVDDKRADPTLRADVDASSVIGVPLTGGGAVIGVLVVTARALAAFTDEDIVALRTVAATAAGALARAEALTGLQHSEERFRTAFTSGPLGMVVLDAETRVLQSNPAMLAMLGARRERVDGARFSSFFEPADAVGLDEDLARFLVDASSGRDSASAMRAECRLRHASGYEVWGLLTVSHLDTDDAHASLLVQIEDITDRKSAEVRLTHQALNDSLTGLPNRIQLLDRLQHALDRGRRTGHTVAVLFCDLDGFKRVNDAFGHDAGDAVLIELARRLRAAVRPADTVGRLGGDEFVVICEDLEAEGDAVLVAGRIEAAVDSPIPYRGEVLRVTASVGVAYSGAESDAHVVLRNADTAMYSAKRRGKNRYEVFDEGLRSLAQRRVTVEAALRRALHADGQRSLSVHYQPIVHAHTGEPWGIEALARLTDEDGNTVSPAEFIAVAEETGDIVAVDRWVLDRGLTDLVELRADNPTLRMTVNMSPHSAGRPDLCEHVLAAIAATGLPVSCLTLEVTETALLRTSPSTRRQLAELRDAGVLLGIDDFGTGYASLRYLSELPAGLLKIDRSFVGRLPDDADAASIVRAVAHLARDLDMLCVAEGVETEAQLAAVELLPIALLQGFLIGRPQSIQDIGQTLTELKGAIRESPNHLQVVKPLRVVDNT
jgi:diguanylate cyclase (GGDEF)-like protein/PAS domain S-box-containing protein